MECWDVRAACSGAGSILPGSRSAFNVVVLCGALCGGRRTTVALLARGTSCLYTPPRRRRRGARAPTLPNGPPFVRPPSPPHPHPLRPPPHPLAPFLVSPLAMYRVIIYTLSSYLVLFAASTVPEKASTRSIPLSCLLVLRRSTIAEARRSECGEETRPTPRANFAQHAAETSVLLTAGTTHPLEAVSNVTKFSFSICEFVCLYIMQQGRKARDFRRVRS